MNLVPLIVIVIYGAYHYGIYTYNQSTQPGASPFYFLHYATNQKDLSTGMLLSKPSYWALEALDPQHLVSGVAGPEVLLGLRLFETVFFVATVVLQYYAIKAAKAANNPAVEGTLVQWLAKFTNWTFLGFLIQSLVGAWLALQAMLNPCPPGSPFTPLDTFYLLTFETVACASLTLTLFYWLVLYKRGSGMPALDNLFRHGVNVGLMLLDLALCRMPIVTNHFQVLVLYATVYVAFLWLFFNTTGWWVYPPLDYRKRSAVVYYTATALLLLFSFITLFVAGALREEVYHVARPVAMELDRLVHHLQHDRQQGGEL